MDNFKDSTVFHLHLSFPLVSVDREFLELLFDDLRIKLCDYFVDNGLAPESIYSSLDDYSDDFDFSFYYETSSFLSDSLSKSNI